MGGAEGTNPKLGEQGKGGTVTRLRSAFETLKTVLLIAVVVLYITGIIHDWVRLYTGDPNWWSQALLFAMLGLLIATGCALAQKGQE